MPPLPPFRLNITAHITAFAWKNNPAALEACVHTDVCAFEKIREEDKRKCVRKNVFSSSEAPQAQWLVKDFSQRNMETILKEEGGMRLFFPLHPPASRRLMMEIHIYAEARP